MPRIPPSARDRRAWQAGAASRRRESRPSLSLFLFFFSIFFFSFLFSLPLSLLSPTPRTPPPSLSALPAPERRLHGPPFPPPPHRAARHHPAPGSHARTPPRSLHTQPCQAGRACACVGTRPPRRGAPGRATPGLTAAPTTPRHRSAPRRRDSASRSPLPTTRHVAGRLTDPHAHAVALGAQRRRPQHSTACARSPPRVTSPPLPSLTPRRIAY